MACCSRSISGPINDRVRVSPASMLYTIAVLLILMRALGMVTSYTLGGFLHILLVLAIATVLIRVIMGRRPV